MEGSGGSEGEESGDESGADGDGGDDGRWGIMERKSGDGDGKKGRDVCLIVAWEGILGQRVLGLGPIKKKAAGRDS